MTTGKFEKTKIEIAKKVMPHLVDPEGYGPANLGLAECAVLMSSDEKTALTPAQAGKLEKSALAMLGSALRAKGISSAAECIPPRR